MAVTSLRAPVEHVVLQVAQDIYLDADGAQTAAELLRKMQRIEFVPHPRLVVFDPAAAGDIPCPAVSVTRLVSFFRSHL
jgi:hypothetical protein